MPAADVSVPNRSRCLRLLSCLALLLACALGGVDAHATPEYPIVLDSWLRLRDPSHTDCDQLTRCLICHTTTRGGQATAVRPFAQTLRRYGLNRGRESQLLLDALNALAMLPEPIDSDDDGISDVDELTICGNPSGAEIGSGPQYGCDGAHLAPASSLDVPLLLMALLCAGVIVQRRRAPAHCSGRSG